MFRVSTCKFSEFPTSLRRIGVVSTSRVLQDKSTSDPQEKSSCSLHGAQSPSSYTTGDGPLRGILAADPKWVRVALLRRRSSAWARPRTREIHVGTLIARSTQEKLWREPTEAQADCSFFSFSAFLSYSGKYGAAMTSSSYSLRYQSDAKPYALKVTRTEYWFISFNQK